jgi:SAM-dependent methyltransferase
MQSDIDFQNSQFWSELCGTAMARSIGITEITPGTLKKFDQAYMEFYPYLASYVTEEDLQNKKVLEIGLGYGTLGQLIFSRHCDYYGLDIAEGPVAMMVSRLRFLGQETSDHIRLGSALEIPYEDECFDYVYSIGCLHHTGNLPKSIAEVYRVLRHGGKAIIMLYNRHSFRQLVHIPYHRLRGWVSGSIKRNPAELKRSLYDTNSRGQAAPYTEFVSRRYVRRLFDRFSSIRIDCRNFDSYQFFGERKAKGYDTHSSSADRQGKQTINEGTRTLSTDFKSRRRILIPREKLLNNLGRIVGLDLYIVARK